MTFRLALRSLAARPVRSAVLSGGFGLGIAVMASLLGIGDVILEQARAPALAGGGDLRVTGGAGRVRSARFLTSSILGAAPFDGRVATASPSDERTLYLVRDGRVLPVRARGGIPSLERRLRDPETTGAGNWRDTAADRSWVAPDPAELLRGMDRFHTVPDAPAWNDSWAEWLYFNGRSGETRFYLSFMTGPADETDRRALFVRLQLELNGTTTNYSDRGEIDEATLLDEAPDLTVGANRLRLEGLRYRIQLDLPEELDGGRSHADDPARRVRGEIVLAATPGRSMPPLAVRGAGGWVSGYVVPVLEGALEGRLSAGGSEISLAGGSGYHDHNWGFWRGVSWRWGQVAGDGLSFVFGRVIPPVEAADPRRVPGFLAVLGPNGPLGYSMDVTIEEDSGVDGHPIAIRVRGRGEALDLTMDLAVERVEVSRVQGPMAAGRELDFVQMRATYRVSGRLAGRDVAFSATGSAETFRGD